MIPLPETSATLLDCVPDGNLPYSIVETVPSLENNLAILCGHTKENECLPIPFVATSVLPVARVNPIELPKHRNKCFDVKIAPDRGHHGKHLSRRIGLGPLIPRLPILIRGQ